MTQPFLPPEPAPSGPPGPTEPFAPVSADAFYASPAPVARRSGGTLRAQNLALTAATLIAGRGVSFAAGRATAPAGDTYGLGQLEQGGLGAPNGGAGGALNGNGEPVPSGGLPPKASLDLNVNGGQSVRGDRNAFGPEGLGSPTVQGTVTAITDQSVTVQLAGGATITVGVDGSTTYHQQTSGSRSDLAAGRTVILRINGRFGPDELQRGGTLGTATDVTVLP
jgi:hypothetical protein